VLYDGVRHVPQQTRIGTILLHLGCVRFPITGPARYTMTASQAIELCGLAQPHTAMPVHYEGWQHFHESPAEVAARFARAPDSVRASLTWLPLGAASLIQA
jgi:L-ascorbate metabolism protein UlaG (beta-lactamase superfamily)